MDYEINWDDVYLTNLNIDIRNLETKKEVVHLDINNISFREKTGFIVTGFKSHTKIKNNHLLINNLLIKTPKSNLNLDTLEYNWIPNKQYWKYFTQKMQQKYIVNNSAVSFEDLAYFNNRLKGFKETIHGKVNVYNTIRKLKVEKIKVWYGDSTIIEGEFKSKGLPYIKETYFTANFSKFQINVNDIEKIFIPWEDDNKYTFPASLSRLGNITYKGDYIGYLGDFKCSGIFHTKAGEINTNIEISPNSKIENLDIKGAVQLNNFNSAILFDNTLYGSLSLKTKLNGKYNNLTGFSGIIKGNISNFTCNDYNYQNISLNGYFEQKRFKGEVKLSDPNINLDFKGSLYWDKESPRANFITSVKNAKLEHLNIVDKKNPLDISFDLLADFSGNSIDNFLGTIKFSNTTLLNKRGKLDLNNFYLFTETKEKAKSLTLMSDFANLNLTGRYNFSALKDHLKNFIYFYIPAYAPDYSFLKNDTINSFSLDLKLKQTSKLFELFYPEIRLKENSTLQWEHKLDKKNTILDIATPYISYKNNNVQNLNINLVTNNDNIDITTTSDKISITDDYSIYNFRNIVKAGNNNYSAEFMWSNWGKYTYSGYFGVEATVSKNIKTGNPYTSIELKPGTLLLADSLWTFNPSTIIIDSNSYQINDFKINRLNQYIGVSGKISENPADSLNLEFHKCDLQELNILLADNKFKLGGLLNGKISIKDYYNNKLTNSNISIKNLVVSKDSIGDIYINSKWNNKTKKLLVNADSWINNVNQLKIKGWYRPLDEKINFTTNLNAISLHYIENHLSSVFSEMKGHASGKINIYNTIDNPNIVGFVSLDSSQFKINYTQTKYKCNDTIYFRARNIHFKDFNLYDDNNKEASLNGNIDFKKDLFLDLNLSFNQFHLLNTTFSDNQSFYGRAYASGLVQVKGDFNDLNIDISAKSEKNTDINIPINQASEAVENDFITFIDKSKKRQDTETNKQKNQIDYSNINLNCNLEITEDANTQIILDSRIGDAIKANGQGDIKLSLDKNGELEIYGNYNISKGSYLFTLQNVINKRFTIAKGSNIKWNGDPYKANIDIKAIYNVKTTLHDLIAEETTTTGLSSTKKVPVSCIMELKENLNNPTINFSIDFPTLDQQTKSYVESLFRSQDDINKQILYLLVLNKFYTPEYITITDESKGYNQNAGVATASELLSNQLSNWLSQISNNVDIGFKYHPKDELSNDEIELALSTQIFNDRVEININGNVDMGNNPNAQERKNNIVGDFDIDVKLNDKGSLRLKAYSHNNEQLTYKSASTTQGVGISYQEEFKKIKDLIKKYFNFLSGKKKK